MRKHGAKIMWQLVGLVKPLLPVMAITISMGVVGFLCAIFITIFAGYGLLNLSGFETVLSNKTILWLLIGCAVLRGILRYAEQASGHYIAFKLLAHIRDMVFTSLRKLAPAKLEGKEKGNLISVITTDIELLEVFYAHTIAPIAIAIITSLIMVVYIGSFHVILAVVALLSYLIIGLLIPYMNSKYGRETGREYRRKFGHLNSYILESLRGIREILQFGLGESRIKSMKEQSDSLDELQGILKKKEGVTKAVTEAVVLLCSLAMLYTSIHLLRTGAIKFDGVLLSVIALMSSFGPVIALSNLSNNLLQTFASGERVLAILEEQPLVEDIVGGTELDKDVDTITVDNVSFAYDEEQVLSNVSLEAKKETIGIWGKSGSGKSTLLKLMMRFWTVDNGQITMGTGKNHTSVNQITTTSLRKNISYMTQETFLFMDTIAANITLGKEDAKMEDIIAAAKKASIHEFIMGLPNGYDTKLEQLGDNLSGGERQRIGLARAFYYDANLLLLDEPTSNLDSLNEAMILKALKEEAKEKTVVIVSHRKSTMNIADRIYHMKSGRVS